mmetsp:Transcript_14650/g.37610  ORF Transcript_14650/g.37610 Transcript_14650/m.37610 type:complete len:220 (-) Transcript_14650:457-1116(-)
MGSGTRGRSYPGSPFGALRIVRHADVVALPGLGLPRQSLHMPGQRIPQAARYLEPRIHAQELPHHACLVGPNSFSEALVRLRNGSALEAPAGEARSRQHEGDADGPRPPHADGTGSRRCVQHGLLGLVAGGQRPGGADPGVERGNCCARRRVHLLRVPGGRTPCAVLPQADRRAGPSARAVLHQGCRVLLLQRGPCPPGHRRGLSVRPKIDRGRGSRLV